MLKTTQKDRRPKRGRNKRVDKTRSVEMVDGVTFSKADLSA